MGFLSRTLTALTLLSFAVFPGNAQCTHDESACRQVVPHFVKFSAIIKHVTGASADGIVALKFVIYPQASGGTPLWQEIQNTQMDSQGRYEVMLGATADTGIPMELFTSGEPRWLGVQSLGPGDTEQPRVLLVSVPYALEAADAQTLGGLPASAFAKVATGAAVEAASTVAVASTNSSATPATTSAVAAVAAVPPPAVTPVHTLNTVPRFAASGGLEDSQITDANGVVGVRNLDNIIFADRFPGGVPDAVTACPAAGCIIYAVSPNVNLNLGNIDPGIKAITIYLGPYVYNVNQIAIRKSLKIIGMGASGGTNGSPTCSVALPCSGTSLQSVNGNNPVFVIPQTNNTPVTNVLLSGFRLLGAAGNTNEDGFFLDTSATLNTGMWYSTIDDVYIEGFAGIPMHIRGRNNDFASATQWVLFNNVIVFRAHGGGNGLRIEGSAFELRFRNCQFDGQAMGDGTNIYIGGLSGGVSGYPTSIAFEGLVSQQAANAVQIDGAFNIVFNASHHELLWNGYLVTNNSGIGNNGLTISDSYFAGNVGVNAGAGYELKIATTSAFGIFFTHNQMFGSPDSVITGTNLASVVYQDNLYAGTLSAPPTSGITPQMNPATSININGVHSVGLNTSATPITTIQSGLGPGETVSFFTLGGPVTFASGGNIDLMGGTSLTVNGTITFARFDLGGPFWRPVSQWSAPAPSMPVAQSHPKVEPHFRGRTFDH